MTFQIGALLHPKSDDPEFAELTAAEYAAREISEQGESRITAVWTGQKEGSELLAIFHNGQRYMPS